MIGIANGVVTSISINYARAGLGLAVEGKRKGVGLCNSDVPRLI